MKQRITKPLPKDIPAEVCQEYLAQYHSEVYEEYRRFLEAAGESVRPGDKKIAMGLLVGLSGGAVACFFSPVPWVETVGMVSGALLFLGVLMVWLTPESEHKPPQSLEAFLRYRSATSSAYQEIAERVYELMLEIRAGLSATPDPQGFLANLYNGRNKAERRMVQLALKLLNE
jgi:hypothetical protein